VTLILAFLSSTRCQWGETGWDEQINGHLAVMYTYVLLSPAITFLNSLHNTCGSFKFSHGAYIPISKVILTFS
jgi:hypothetical protein